MATTAAYLLLPFSLLLAVSASAMYSVCPSECECTENEEMSMLRGNQLIDVDCRDRGLSELPDLDLLKNVSIHRLYLNGNRINNIPDGAFDGFQIIGIELADNPLKEISRNAFIGLQYTMEYLSMQRSQLTKKPRDFLNGLKMLRTLDLTGVTMNSLSNGTFGTLRMLETLVLKECGITSIEDTAFVGVEAILELRLDGNSLSSIPIGAFRHLMELRVLNMNQNQISGLQRGSFLSQINLRKLYLSNNKLSNVKEIDRSAFRGIGHNLMELDLSFNQMSVLPTHAFHHLFNLATLKLSDNQLTFLENGTFEKMTHLMSLDLSGNMVEIVPGILRGLEMSLVNLFLARTGLTSDTIPVDTLKRYRYLRHLDLSENQFETLTNESFSGLTVNKLRLAQCRIANIDPNTFSQLRSPLDVDLSYNNIQKVTFLTDPCVFEKLDFTDNALECDCDFLQTVKLQTTKFVGKCDTPQYVNDQDIAASSKNSEMMEMCEWGNQTETVTCEWMSSSTSSIYVSFLVSALGLVILACVL